MLLSAFGCSSAWAADDCKDPETTIDMRRCAAQELKQVDAKLNAAYTKLLAAIDEESKARLRETERAWIAFRDKECLFRTHGGADQEGSIWPQIVLQCTTDLTKQRLHELRSQLKCQSWDLSCPAQ